MLEGHQVIERVDPVEFAGVDQALLHFAEEREPNLSPRGGQRHDPAPPAKNPMAAGKNKKIRSYLV